MNKTTQRRFTVFTLLVLMLSVSVFAQQRLMEKIDRGVVAVNTENGVFLSWRKLVTDSDNAAFNVYRNSVLVNTSPITEVSNYLDENGTTESYYYVEVLENSVAVETSQPVVVWENGYKEIPLQTPSGYKPNDATVADLDGDGAFEIVVKMQGTTKDNSQSGSTDPVYLHAYEMNGTLLWSINLGINIRAGSHYTQFMVYDLNGDGFAELACKTAPGTKDGTGNYLSNGVAANDDDAADYSNSGGYILEGPEYLTLFEGKTGKEISTVRYVPGRGNVSDWGDSYGNRVDRFLAGVAYFDSIPSLVMARGYYTRTVLAAWDYKNGELVQRWVFDTDVDGTGADGNAHSLYAGQGAHSLTVGDIDNDGLDEIVYGAMAVNDDGTGLWTTGNNHGDAAHLGDFLPNREGMEYWMPSESAYYTNKVTGEKIPAAWLADAATGEIIWQKDVSSSADVGRAMVADVSAEHPGCEFWAASPIYNLYDQDGNKINYSVEGPSINFGSWWDGDLQREVLSGNAIKKWTPTIKESLLEPEECASNNSTKATPALSGDIIGDWREEVIWRTSDNQSLRIYTTTHATDYGIYSLLQDPQYRLALTWQNVAYNQPPHPSFYLGGGMDDPAKPSIKMIEPDVEASIQITNPVADYLLELGNALHVVLNVVGIKDTTTIYLSNGETLLDSVSEAPYIIQMDKLSTGDYSLVAWSYDAEMNKVESLPVHVTVDEGYPHIALTSPADGAIYKSNDSILLSADAYDSNGSVDNVTFYFNGDVAATITGETYSQYVTSPGYGIYDVKAVVTDNDGYTDETEIHTINIGEPLLIQEEETGFCGFLTTGYIESNNEGFTGVGFANTANATGAGISWAIKVQTAGNYKFYWRYATSTERSATLTIGETTVGSTLAFTGTEGWTSWELQASEDVYLEVGDYEVKLTATSSGGLGNIDYMKILSFNDEAAEALDCESIGTAIGDVMESVSNQISMYPVPASESINIKVINGNSIINRVSVHTITGKELISKAYSQTEVSLDISQLNSGIYLVKFNTSEGIGVKEFIVE